MGRYEGIEHDVDAIVAAAQNGDKPYCTCSCHASQHRAEMANGFLGVQLRCKTNYHRCAEVNTIGRPDLGMVNAIIGSLYGGR